MLQVEQGLDFLRGEVGFQARKCPNLNLPRGIIYKTIHFCALQTSCDDHNGDDDDDDNDNDNDDDDDDDDDDHLLLDDSSSISYRYCFVAGICRSRCTGTGRPGFGLLRRASTCHGTTS